VLYKIDNGEWKKYTGVFSILKEGSHQIGFHARDAVGNRSNEKVVDVIIDNTPPEIKIAIDGVKQESGCFVHPQAVFSLTAIDNASGVDEVLCRIDDGEWKKYSGTFSISDGGSHQIGFLARDTVGNQSEEKMIDVIVDNTPPEIKIMADGVKLKSGCFVHPDAVFSLIAIDDASGVDEVLYKIDNGEWKKYTGVFSILKEGSHQIGFRARDAVGNQSNEKVIDVIVDNTPPEIKIAIDGVKQEQECFVHPQTVFSLIATDNASGVDEVSYKIDDGEWKKYNGTFSILKEGSHQIGFMARDIVGNQSEEKMIKIIVDSISPKAVLITDKDKKVVRKSTSKYFVQQDTGFSLIAIDDASGTAIDDVSGVDEILCRIDNGEWKKSSEEVFSISEEGSHQIGFRARDIAGNQSKEKMIEVIVDSTPPSVVLITDKNEVVKDDGSKHFVQPDTGFSLVAIDDTSGVDEVLYRIDNEWWKRYTGGVFLISEEGSHQIRFRARDTLGNQSEKKMIDVIVDNTPPKIKIEIDGVKQESGCFVHPQAVFSLIATDNASGVDEVSYKIDDEEPKKYTGTFSICQEGSHRIGFRARDTLGNQSKELIIKAIVDSTPPSVVLITAKDEIVMDSDHGYFVHPDSGFLLTAIDDASGVDEILFRIDDGEWKKYTGTFSILEEGSHQIGFRARDTLGNQSEELMIKVIVDSLPPKVVFATDKDEKVVRKGNLEYFVHPNSGFSLTAIDDVSGVDEVLYRIDNEEWKKYNGTFSILEEGSHQIRFQAGDIAGNQSKVKMVKVIVDSTPPGVVLVTAMCKVVRNSDSVFSRHTLRLKTKDAGVGIDKLYLSVDQSELTEYKGPFSISDKGIHQIRFQSTDLLGNRSDTETFQVIIKPKRCSEGKMMGLFLLNYLLWKNIEYFH
ncbi:MAG: Ig-like domain-containing protein, partial [bacterium]